MKTLFIFLTAILTSVTYTPENLIVDNSNNCSSELRVEKDRNFKSADEDGTSYKLILKNLSSASQTYALSTNYLSKPCSNTRSDSGQNANQYNVELNVSMAFNRGNDQITLQPGQSEQFTINISVPEGTPYNSWSCINVEAKSDKCDSGSSSTILSVYIPNPSEG
jgi:hypothetical protein